jgi:tetratricopeptide (TPR) repeat protein
MTKPPVRGRVVSLTLGALLWVSLSPGAALGIPINKLRTQLADLEQQAAFLNVQYKTQVGSKEQIAEHRLVDAQVLYTLKDYTRAAILLLDYVAKYKDTRGYPEALFFLADSLYHKRDFLSARRYFKRIATQVRGKYYQEALQRLVELSLRTGDYSDVQQYLDALANIPPSMLKPSVPYVQGKYYYFRKQWDRAQSTFRSIPQGHKYYMHAQYFIGAIMVRRKSYAEASTLFKALLRTQPKSNSQKHIRDLAYLAVGRLLYEKGKMEQAIDMYQKIGRRSPEFDTSLYEIAWAYIKAKQYKRALRALDLLVLAQPESPFIPQVKVLQGNLLIRLERWGRATDLFTKTREKFMPVHNRMKQVLTEQRDPNVFFDVLLARNMGALSTTIQVPKLAIHWVKENSNVKRSLNLVADVREIQASIKEAEQLIRRLERAVNTPAKIKIFPEFAAAKARSLEIENKLLNIRQQILRGEFDLVKDAATGSERAELETLSARRARLEKRVKELPTTASGYEKREKDKLKKLEKVSHRLKELELILDSLRAQLVAAEKYVADTATAKNKEGRESFKQDATQIREMIKTLESEMEELKAYAIDAKGAVGVGGAAEVAERGIKGQYREALSKEHAMLASLSGRVSGSRGSDFNTLAGLLSRCDKIDKVLSAFDQRLDAGVEQKLAGIRDALKEEKANVQKYATELGQYKGHTDRVAGALTYEGFQKVATRFYEIVVRADVGIIDVAWALKDAKSKEVSRLVRQQKMDLKVLDSEFREVLKED